MTDFTGKNVLITGAGGGIGQSLCRYFAERGGRIGALDINPAVADFTAQLTEEGHEAVALTADTARTEQVEGAIAHLHKCFGTIDILINNAGFSSAATLELTTPANWHKDITGNLGGAYHCAHLALIDMMAGNGGNIINISSVNGLQALGDPAYSAAKSGLISFTKSIAMEYGKFGVRANVICPGTVRTPIWDHRIERNPEILSDLVKWYPLGRIADPIDITKAAAFLASDDAAAITGATLPVDCGLTAGNIVMTRELTLADI